MTNDTRTPFERYSRAWASFPQYIIHPNSSENTYKGLSNFLRRELEDEKYDVRSQPTHLDKDKLKCTVNLSSVDHRLTAAYVFKRRWHRFGMHWDVKVDMTGLGKGTVFSVAWETEVITMYPIWSNSLYILCLFMLFHLNKCAWLKVKQRYWVDQGFCTFCQTCNKRLIRPRSICGRLTMFLPSAFSSYDCLVNLSFGILIL